VKILKLAIAACEHCPKCEKLYRFDVCHIVPIKQYPYYRKIKNVDKIPNWCPLNDTLDQNVGWS
jgi:hypothetical protein